MKQLAPRGRLALAGSIATALALVLQSGTPPAGASDVVVPGASCPGPAVDPPTRMGMIKTANSYPQFHVERDGSHLRLASDVVRIENGGVTATDAQTICENWSAFYGETDMSKKWSVVTDDGWVVGFFAANELTTPTYFAGRFRVEDGLIQHFEEVIYGIDPLSHVSSSTSGVTTMPTAEVDRVFAANDLAVGPVVVRTEVGDVVQPKRASRPAVRRAVQSYLGAFTTRSADHVLLHPAAVRVENHRLRGSNAAEIRAQLEAPTMTITQLHDVTIDIEGDSAVAFYRYDWGRASIGVAGTPFANSEYWAATRFHVSDGLITEIESICSGLGGTDLYCGDEGPAT